MNTNLFHYATKELSQDAVIACILAQNDEHSRNFVRAMLNTSLPKSSKPWWLEDFDVVNIETQIDKIDILVTLSANNGKETYKIIIEDKTDTEMHERQLTRYTSIVFRDDESVDGVYFVLFKTLLLPFWEVDHYKEEICMIKNGKHNEEDFIPEIIKDKYTRTDFETDLAYLMEKYSENKLAFCMFDYEDFEKYLLDNFPKNDKNCNLSWIRDYVQNYTEIYQKPDEWWVYKGEQWNNGIDYREMDAFFKELFQDKFNELFRITESSLTHGPKLSYDILINKNVRGNKEKKYSITIKGFHGSRVNERKRVDDDRSFKESYTLSPEIELKIHDKDGVRILDSLSPAIKLFISWDDGDLIGFASEKTIKKNCNKAYEQWTKKLSQIKEIIQKHNITTSLNGKWTLSESRSYKELNDELKNTYYKFVKAAEEIDAFINSEKK